jgi:hypothetical protein
MSNEHKQIVILGDWFIDENWLMREHFSASSSFTGASHSHYLVDHKDISQSIISLCGASSHMQILRSYFNTSGLKALNFRFTGYGLWSPDDNEILKCVFCDQKNTNLSPFTLVGPQKIAAGGKCPYKGSKCSYNETTKLSPIITIPPKDSYSIPTNRIIRTYKVSANKKPLLDQRFDWELPGNVRSINKKFIKFRKRDLFNTDNIHSVIIVDHDRGAVTEEIVDNFIETMGEKITGAKWYVRSTVHNPKWIKALALRGIKIHLRLISESEIICSAGQKKWHFGAELGIDSINYIARYKASIDNDVTLQ